MARNGRKWVKSPKSGVQTLNNARKPPTDREIEVLAAMVDAGSIEATAQAMGLHHQTVRNHLTSAYRALGVNRSISAYRKLGWLKQPSEWAEELIEFREGLETQWAARDKHGVKLRRIG